MSETLRLQFPSHPKFLSLLRKIVATAAEMVGFGETEIGTLQLIMAEAVTNIIRHSLKNDFCRTIEADFVLREGAFEVVLRDDGEPAGEDDLKPKDPSPDRPGGLGLHLMYECMDEVSHVRLPNDQNQLRLVMHLK
jgi:serine/threonine-protein kinase RsbW